MARIVEDADIGGRNNARELAHLGVEGPLVEIEPQDHAEARVIERRRHLVGVIRGVGEGARMHVSGVADDQRDPLLRGGRQTEDQRGETDACKTHNEAHGDTKRHGWPSILALQLPPRPQSN